MSAKVCLPNILWCCMLTKIDRQTDKCTYSDTTIQFRSIPVNNSLLVKPVNNISCCLKSSNRFEEIDFYSIVLSLSISLIEFHMNFVAPNEHLNNNNNIVVLGWNSSSFLSNKKMCQLLVGVVAHCSFRLRRYAANIKAKCTFSSSPLPHVNNSFIHGAIKATAKEKTLKTLIIMANIAIGFCWN